MLMTRGIIRSLLQTGFFAAILLIPAGTWQWPRAIQFLVFFGVLSLLSIVALARLAPASLEARIQRGSVKNQPRADRVASLLIALSHIAWFIFIPIDVFRLQLLPAPPLWLSALGGVLCLTAYGIMMTAVWQNSFAAPIVGDQSERGQTVIDTGLYGRIRHPMYLGHLLFLIGLALWLESTTSALLVPLVFASVIVRILVEEGTLRTTLTGYREYTTRVPYRLIPLVW
jgi:protein-S-isoprenylcysteine O-methyltransferase Ste14